MMGTITFSLENSKEGISALEAGVSQLVSKLPFLGGNVVWTIDPDSGKGVGEVHPPTAATWSTYPMLCVRHHGGKYTPVSYERPTGPGRCNTVSYDDIFREEFLPMPLDTVLAETHPVLRFQANVLEDGIILCASVHHNAIDGRGIYTVMEALAACCRNPTNVQQNELAIDPISEAVCRKRLSAAASPAPDAFVVLRGENCPIPAAPDRGPQAPITRLLVLSGERVIQLRSMCNALVRDEARGDAESSEVENPKLALSSHDIISALMWLCVLRSRARSDPQFPRQGKSHFAFATDVRTLMSEDLWTTYIGNCVIPATIESPFSIQDAVKSASATISSPGQFDLSLIARLALAVRSGFRSVGKTQVTDVISSIGSRNEEMLSACAADFGISSMRHTGFYKLKFGPVLGRVAHADIPDPRMQNQAWVLPDRYVGHYARSPWEIRIALEPMVMEYLLEDRLFGWMQGTELCKL
ncbi:O-acetyltransferase [Aspergillus nomiae NRRL 13137]|uniref:O-acetyltransferase n=1 Tax=Aspergillus nomiae NRRL (strain ATCC 15546 / NRRL 13137 / CBS 260.88 / M93) TaxID=1509407 RepID=A0A0L1JC36_ASPN3|nr:O-acetyltransferase [Aspergillus nomiae NRRL 13137]KNG89314.1 O-acetyltransferase [Aspergillus nomiae NRRL 13137]